LPQKPCCYTGSQAHQAQHHAGGECDRELHDPADDDGIVPVTDMDWFDDDAARRVREFLLAVWGAETLDENMGYLAENLGKKAGKYAANFYGNPSSSVTVIGITGTNGKGSVCAAMESVLKHRGYKTGFFSSPHLVCMRERIRFCGEMIEKDEFTVLFKRVFEVSDKISFFILFNNRAGS